MTEQNLHDENNLETEIKQENSENDASEQEQAQETDAEMTPSLEELNTKLSQENDALRDQVLRLAADMENLRTRTARDVNDARLYSIAQFARDMLSVSDNLERALATITEDERNNNQQLNNLAQGIELTERAMIASLERHGVKKIEPLNEKFDPNFHQAMFEIQDENLPNNTVAQIVQVGYSIGERVLRPALVGISKTPTKTETTEENPQ